MVTAGVGGDVLDKTVLRFQKNCVIFVEYCFCKKGVQNKEEVAEGEIRSKEKGDGMR